MAYPLLLERDAELDQIDRLARGAVSGTGRIAVLEASAGLGKTALMAAAAEHLSARGMQVLRARGSDLEREFPWGIVRSLFERPLSDRATRRVVLVGAALGAAALVDGPKPNNVVEPDDRTSFPMLHALYWLVANLCLRNRIALLVNDAHEADDNSLQFLTYLAPRIDELPALVLLGSRPSAQAPGNGALERFRSEPAVVPLTITPLSLDAVIQLVRDRLGSAPHDDFAEACNSATGGNPFYLGELLRDIAARDVEPTAENAALIAKLTPPTIIRSLLFRLAGLGRSALPLVRAAAVLGDGCALGASAQLADVAVDDAAHTADELAKSAIINPGSGITFAHPILRAAVLSDLGAHERERWHAKAAELLTRADADPQVIGLHLLRTEPTANPTTVDTLRRAAHSAMRTGSPGTAAEYLARALSEPASDELVDDVIFDLGVAQAAVGDPAGIGNIDRATAATREPPLRVGRALTLAELQLRSGLLESAMTVLEAARPYADSCDADLRLRLEAVRYWVGRQRANTFESVRTSWPGLRNELDGPPSIARSELAVYLALEAVNVCPYAEASALLDVGLRSPGLVETVGPDSSVVIAALLTLHTLERHDDFDRLANVTLAEAGRRGAVLGFVHVSTMRSHELYLRGRLDEAEAEAEAAVHAASPRGWQYIAPGLTAIRAIIALERARFDEVEALIERSGYDLDDPQDVPTGLLLDIRGVMRMSIGAVQDGLADLLRCGDLLQALGVTNPGIVPWRSHAALGHLALRDLDAAQALAGEDLALAQRLSGPVAVGGALRVLGLSTPSDDGIDLLREAVTTLKSTPARVEIARALVDLGATLRRRGQPVAAREPLQEGLDRALASGSVELAARAREELLASGARPRRARRSSLDQLTPSEARVARLAATGMSNSAIAQSLFITRKTVEKHLANAYRKLGIRSKAELDPSRLDDA